jgi:hypothetical protein
VATPADVWRRPLALQARQMRSGTSSSIRRRCAAAGVSGSERPVGLLLGQARVALRDVSLLKFTLDAPGAVTH